MPMNPRTLRPSRGVPVFSEKGYARLWGLSNLQSKTISGVVETDTGQYAVKFGNQQPVLYSSGDVFCETPVADESPYGHAVTPSGEALLSTSLSRWGNASGYFGGSGYLSVASSTPVELGSQDFTLEAWCYLLSAGVTRALVSKGGEASVGLEVWSLELLGDGSIGFYVSASTAELNSPLVQSASPVPIGQWFHVAVVRSGGSTSLYVNGLSVDTATESYTIDSGGPLIVGAGWYAPAQRAIFGHIDGLRVVKGSAIYTANFSLPTAALTAVSGTSLLLNFDAPAGGGTRAFEVYPATAGIQVPQSSLSATPDTELLLSFNGSLNDSSGSGRTATATGGATISTANSKWGGSSLYVSGTSTSVTVPLSSDFEFGTGDFTVEAWVYDTRPGDRLRVAGIGIGANAGTPHDKTGWSVLIRDGGQLWLYQYDGTTETYYDSPAGSVPQDEWAHVVVTRAAGTLRMFVNGAQVAVHTGVTLPLNAINSEPLYVGTFREAGGLFDLDAYISDLRIIKGASAYSLQTVPSGQFDGFDLSGNSLTAVRSEGAALEQSAGYTQTVYPYNYVPPGPEGGIVSNNSLSSQALDQFYADLLAGSGSLTVTGNPGIDADDPAIATDKGYTVFGSVPPSTALLLHFDGNFTDSSPNGLTVTASGGAVTSTAQSKWGGASLYLDGSGCVQATHAALNPGHEDFTLEAWVRPTSITFNQLFSYREGSNASLAFYDDGGVSRANYRFGAFDESAAGYVANQWHHIALVRNGGDVVLYLNGTSVTTSSGDAAINYATLTIGAVEASNASERFIGYIDDVRVIIGAALYTANFTPPTGPLGVYP